MAKLRKNDTVLVLSGKDKGKTGKVLATLPKRNRVIVEGVNFVKKHAKQRKQQDKAGIIEQESSIALSNLNIVCKGCNRATRISIDTLKDGSKVRYCKRCNEVL